MAATYEQGEQHLADKDYTSAFKVFAPLAKQGDKRAQYQIGLMLLKGNNIIKKDTDRAVEWLKKAAKQNCADSQYELGCLYEAGDKDAGLQRDIDEAFQWMKKSAENKHPLAQYRLALLYGNDPSIDRTQCVIQVDLTRMVYWFAQAAAQGDEKSIQVLWDLHRSTHPTYVGLFSEEDMVEMLDITAKTYKEFGDEKPQTMIMLGAIYCTGKYNNTKAPHNPDQGRKLIQRGVQLLVDNGQEAEVNVSLYAYIGDVCSDLSKNTAESRTQRIQDLDMAIEYWKMAAKYDKHGLLARATTGADEVIAQLEQRRDSLNDLTGGNNIKNLREEVLGMSESADDGDNVVLLEEKREISESDNSRLSDIDENSKEEVIKAFENDGEVGVLQVDKMRTATASDNSNLSGAGLAHLESELEQVRKRLAVIDQELEIVEGRITPKEKFLKITHALIFIAIISFIVYAIFLPIFGSADSMIAGFASGFVFLVVEIINVIFMIPYRLGLGGFSSLITVVLFIIALITVWKRIDSILKRILFIMLTIGVFLFILAGYGLSLLSFGLWVVAMAIVGAIVESIHGLFYRSAAKSHSTVIRVLFTILMIPLACMGAIILTNVFTDTVLNTGARHYQETINNTGGFTFVQLFGQIARNYIEAFSFDSLPMLTITIHSSAWVLAAITGCVFSTARLAREKRELINKKTSAEDEAKSIEDAITTEERRIADKKAAEEQRIMANEAVRRRELAEREEMEREYGALMSRVKRNDNSAKHELDSLISKLKQNKTDCEAEIIQIENAIRSKEWYIDRARKMADKKKREISAHDLDVIVSESGKILAEYENATANDRYEVKSLENQRNEYRSKMRDIEKKLRYLKG